MKILRLIDIPDLKTPQGINDFAIRDKYTSSSSLALKFEERFPIQPKMPIAPPNVNVEKLSGQKKTLMDLNWGDWKLIHLAMEKSVKEDIEKRIEFRKFVVGEQVQRSNEKAIVDELFFARFRIFMTWLSRFRMEQVFHELGIKNLDDFKRQMHVFYQNADEKHRLQLDFYLRQFGMDPGQQPIGLKLLRMTGKDELLERMAVEYDRSQLTHLDAAKLQLAQMQSAQYQIASSMKNEQTNQWIQSLQKDHSLSYLKIKGLK